MPVLNFALEIGQPADFGSWSSQTSLTPPGFVLGSPQVCPFTVQAVPGGGQLFVELPPSPGSRQSGAPPVVNHWSFAAGGLASTVVPPSVDGGGAGQGRP